MRTIKDINPNWKADAPSYDNLMDKRTMEYGLSAEMNDIKKELQELVELTDKINSKLVGGLQQGNLTTWTEVGNLTKGWSEIMEERLALIQERFN
jgi:hypothetical protein